MPHCLSLRDWYESGKSRSHETSIGVLHPSTPESPFHAEPLQQGASLMYENFGTVVTDHTVEFRLFFPDTAKDPTQYSRGGLPKIKRLQATGDFQSQIGGADWDLSSAPEMARTDHDHGILYTYRIEDLRDGFYQYKYFLTYENQTTRWCGDPCTKYVATKEENAGFVVGGSRTTVRPIANRL